MSEDSNSITQQGKVIVGITGNIATGKSAVMRLATEAGALALDADKIVHEMMNTDTAVQAAIAVAFGSEIRLPDGRINRRALGKIVFNDDSALRDLEQIVHPPVRLAIGQKIKESDKEFVFLEAIKLLEGDLVDLCHQIWVTRCPRRRQLERLTICRGLDAQTATQRIEMQPPQDDKVAQADVVIDTAGLMRETEMQFEMAWSRLPSPESAEPFTLPVPAAGTMAPPLMETTRPEAKSTEAETPPVNEKKTGLSRPIPAALKKKLGKTLPKPSKPVSPGAAAEKPAAAQQETAEPAPASAPQPPGPATPVEVRRARPSDIPSILLLIHKATEGKVKLKRVDMLMALGERSYFIGQSGTEVQAVIGWSIENLVSRIDQLYFHPPEAVLQVGAHLLASIEESADQHICEIIVAFLDLDAPPSLNQLFADQGFAAADLSKMPVAWRAAIRESQPDNTRFVIKVLRERVTHPM